MRYSVDAISLYVSDDLSITNKYVLIRRLTFPCGLAFPGGGIERGEDRQGAVIREMEEETGLTFTLIGWIPKVYNQEGRDPRFPTTSYIAYGKAEGTIRPEQGKTEALLLSKEEILERKEEFAFDHFEIFLDYLNFVRN